MKERVFIQKAKEQISLVEFIKDHFRQAKVSSIDVQRTPVVTRIILYTTTPGLIIGSGGERIKEVIEILKVKYSIENPQIDVQKIEDADLDPNIIAQTIASQIESGVNFKRIGNYYVERIMGAGAIGCEIIITGKLSGERSRRERFYAGYLKKCGEPATQDVMKGFAFANPKLGNIGVTVKIMITQPEKLLKIGKETPMEGEKSGNIKNEENPGNG
ncbi:MAG: 30S ribosomal protein S3 [Candidatus Aenigmarchaeota archaeon]|nr:30S ribosomal protein S3 [Candidatus Aenigmarchaeota archaeon]MDI6722039.1 30S ribosomal protein S3 [Candidatus Aenigmarchaeota archaeon]